MSRVDPQALLRALLHPSFETPHPRPAHRRIRAVWNGNFFLDTADAVYVWEHQYYPQFYVPRSALDKKKKRTTPTKKPQQQQGGGGGADADGAAVSLQQRHIAVVDEVVVDGKVVAKVLEVTEGTAGTDAGAERKFRAVEVTKEGADKAPKPGGELLAGMVRVPFGEMGECGISFFFCGSLTFVPFLFPFPPP
jgi:hypothetical protein